jgi:spore cortex formation protein SpoVR/YcgB (stage V sporulation)
MRMTANQYNQSIALSETKEQTPIAQLLDRIKYNGRPLRWTHIPNEGKRTAKTGAILKAKGMKSGLPDIMIFDSPPSAPLMKGAALEMKKRIGGIVSDEQQDWLDYFNANSWVVGVARGQDEALKFLEEWGYIS